MKTAELPNDVVIENEDGIFKNCINLNKINLIEPKINKIAKFMFDKQKFYKGVFHMINVNVKNGEIPQQEIDAYIAIGLEKYPNRKISAIEIEVDGDYVNLQYHFEKVPFQRIRRITGYLVGDLSRFNNAKLSEVNQRLKHDNC